MAVLKWLIAGLVGAGIGGAIWVAVAYYANYEVGYIAWGIGLLAGLGVRRTMSADEINPGAGVAAVGAALLMIAISKYYVAHLAAKDAAAQIAGGKLWNDPVAQIAADVIKEKEAAGETVAPTEFHFDETGQGGEPQVTFAPEIQAEAQRRWDAMPETERAQLQEAQRIQGEAVEAEMVSEFRDMGFKGSFGPFDLLWFGLATMTAYKVGRGIEPETPLVTKPDPVPETTGAPPDAEASQQA